jgi:hypothetical protein
LRWGSQLVAFNKQVVLDSLSLPRYLAFKFSGARIK